MSLVKFTELPAGSIQGGDVFAVAGASSYKVTAVEYANWSNKRIQGNTDKTIENAYKYAASNDYHIKHVVNPQLGQIGTNKSDIANLKVLILAGDLAIKANTNRVATVNTTQYDNQPSIIASIIKNDNYIKNPAAQNIGLYWKDSSDSDLDVTLIAELSTRNLEYPGWSRAGDLLTYNFTVALDGMLTIGQLGGTSPEELEYRINGGAWGKVGGDGIKSVSMGYVSSTAGVQISVRMSKDSGGIAFAIPSPAYWTTTTGVRDPNVRVGLEKLTYGLRRKRIDLEACGYWFAEVGNSANEDQMIWKPTTIGRIIGGVTFEYEHSRTTRVINPTWSSPNKNAFRVSNNALKTGHIFASTDPDSYNKAEVY